jgi:hypothetical protein
MLYRRESDGVVAIPQPSHAWLSGQLARAWGNDDFTAPEPYEEVCLGAEQHDIAWLEWERHPTFDSVTGLPHDFREVDTLTRVALWSAGIETALAYGLYPALLVSLHAHTIHALLPRARERDAGRGEMQAFLDTQKAFRANLLAALARQAQYRDLATPEVAERNRLLIYAVDFLSLAICWGVREEVIIPGVSPDGRDKLDLRLRSRAGEPDDLILEPWPFTSRACHVVCEGRRLGERFSDEASMRRALADPGTAVVVEATLRPR